MLRPSDASGLVSSMRGERQHLSPAVGLALSGSGSFVLSRLYELEPLALSDGAKLTDGTVWRGTPSCRLARALFYRVEPDEPLRPSTNRSLPSAHLSPSLAAHVVALADAGLGSDGAVHTALRGAVCSETGQTLPALARETGVTIARFERLVEAVREADLEAEGAEGRLNAPTAAWPLRGTAMLLRHMWLRTSPRGKAALWPYLRVLHVEYGGVLTDCALARPGWAEALANPSMPAPTDFVNDQLPQETMQPTSALRAVMSIFRTRKCSGNSGHRQSVAADNFALSVEVVAAAAALSAGDCPPLQEQKVGPCEGAPAVADCAELTLRELFNLLLWSRDAQAFEPMRLPSSADARLREFYSPGGGAMTARAAAVWMEIVSDLPGVTYLETCKHPGGQRTPSEASPSTRTRTSPSLRYEMRPSGENILAAAGVLLGVRTPTAAALQELWLKREPLRKVEFRRVVGIDDRLQIRESGALRLELVLSSGRNHAYAVHHAKRPPWLHAAAEIVAKSWSAEFEGSITTNEDTAPASMGGTRNARGVLLGALRPALLQPLLQISASEMHRLAPLGDGAGPLNNRKAALRAWQRRERLMLLCTNPTEPSAVAASIRRLLSMQALAAGRQDPIPSQWGHEPHSCRPTLHEGAMRHLQSTGRRLGSGTIDSTAVQPGVPVEDVFTIARVLRQPWALGGRSLADDEVVDLANTLAPLMYDLDEPSSLSDCHPLPFEAEGKLERLTHLQAARAELGLAIMKLPSLAACLASSMPHKTGFSVLIGAVRASPLTALRLGARGLLRTRFRRH